MFLNRILDVILAAAAIVVVAVVPSRAASPTGLVAHWTFDKADGDVIPDDSGNENNAALRGPTIIEGGRNRALRFDGRDDFVDCGNRPALNLTEAVTVRAWIYPDVRPVGEVGVVVKHDISAFGLTYYTDGQCWWYIAGGGNNCKASVGVGGWHQVTGTYDGKTMHLYVDGKHKSSRPLKGPIPTNADLAIGKWPLNGRCFAGKIDDVQIYNRALSPDEIRRAYQAEARSLLVRRPRIKDGIERAGTGFRLRVAPDGAAQITVGQDAYFIESAFSYPGARIGWNALAIEDHADEISWQPRATPVAPNTIDVEATGTLYTLRRQYIVEADRIDIRDTLANTGTDDVGIITRYALIADGGLTGTFPEAGGTAAENPTLLLSKPASSLGVVLEDDVARLQANPSVSVNQASITIANFVLPPGKSYTFRWSLFPAPEPGDYFGLIRKVRNWWGSNFPVQGPFAFFDATSGLIDDPDALRRFLKWKKLKLVGLSPWLDYDPGSMDHVIPRDEYKTLMQKAVKALKRADPAIQCLGCIETDWVTLNPADIPDGERLPQHGGGSTGNVELTAEQTLIIDNAHLPWHDSFKRKASGNLVLELYSRGGKPQTAIWVYPEIGNHQHAFLLGQVKFLLDEVGLDGFYIDEFSQGWRGSQRTCNKRHDGTTWDGISGDIDPSTGKITGKYTDCSLAGIQARVDLCKYALDRGRIVVANTYSTSAAEQSLPVHRFAETLWHFDPAHWPAGRKPPLVSHLYRGHLDSPIGLGVHHNRDDKDLAGRLNKAVVAYLRHGLVYYHYALPDPPRGQDVEDEAPFGPINHMFPITPVNIGQGFIEGPERVVTCVSRSFDWPYAPRPSVWLFDPAGRRVEHDITPEPRAKHWTVKVDLEDWSEIAVITGPRPEYVVDLDGDGDVDETDFQTFTACLNGSGRRPRSDCRNYLADLDNDDDVDNNDMLTFSGCFNGSGHPPKPTGPCRKKTAAAEAPR